MIIRKKNGKKKNGLKILMKTMTEKLRKTTVIPKRKIRTKTDESY